MHNAILDRDLKVSWLDKALGLAVQATPFQDARKELLESLNSAGLGREAARKTVGVLSRVWLQPAVSGEAWAQWALDHFDSVSDRRVLHVGALLATEGFFRALLEAVGRELRSSEEVDTVQVRRRLRDVYGPKRSIDIAAQRGIKTLRALGLLQGKPSESLSHAGGMEADDPELAAWLAGCLIRARATDSISVADLKHATELFGVRMPKTLPKNAAGVQMFAEGGGRSVLVLA